MAIRERERDNPDFSFLFDHWVGPASQYHIQHVI
jgi:hypothetical protein